MSTLLWAVFLIVGLPWVFLAGCVLLDHFVFPGQPKDDWRRWSETLVEED